MIVLTIGATNYIDIIKEQIEIEFNKITQKELIPTYTFLRKGDINFIIYEISDKELLENYSSFFSDALKLYASYAITNVIIEFIRFDLIKDILEAKFPRYLTFENGKILDIIKDFYNENGNNDNPLVLNYSYRKEIMNSLMDFFEDHNELILEGFVQFRLKEYKENLEKAIDYIIKEYETQKEYKEFLRLLKYFVDVQEMKEEVVHIVGTKNERFRLFDKDKNDITNRCKQEFEQDFNNKEINYDDFLVSALITIAPKQIIIHNYKALQNKPIFETIINIFQGKVTICSKCDFCTNSHEK